MCRLQIQVLSLGSTALSNDTNPVGLNGVVTGSTVALALTSTPSTIAAVVHVALPVPLQPSHGTTLTFAFKSLSHTVSSLKAQVEGQTGLAAAEQSLSFAASSLDATPGSALLSSVGIVDGSTVYLSVSSSSAPMVVHVSLPASLNNTFGSTLTFHGGSVSDLVASLEAKVESVTGVPTAIQVLSLGSTALDVHTSTVGSYGIVSGSTVVLTLTRTPPSMAALVHVALPVLLQPSHGTTLTFGLATLSDTLFGLRAQVQAQTGLAASEQSLSFAASSLDATPGSALLSSVGIVDGSTVYLSAASTSAPFVVHVSLPSSLSSTFGSTLTFRGGSVSDLVSSLEAKVESVTGVPAAVQVLSLGSMVFAVETSTVGSYGLVSGSTVALLLTGTYFLSDTVLYVALPHSLELTPGLPLTLGLTPLTDTVSGLRAKIEAQTGLAVAEQSLSIAGTPMDFAPDSASLSSFGIVDGSTVDLTFHVSATLPVAFEVHVSLPASLNGTFGSTLTFRGGSVSDLVSSLEAKVESVTGVPAAIQVLSLGSTALAADTSTLSAYGVVSGSLIALTLTSTPPSVVAMVHVALPVSLQPSHGTTLTFGLDILSDTVSGLMVQLEAQTGLVAAEQSLSFAASLLDATPSSALLSSIGIVNGSTVYLSMASSAAFVVHVSLPASLSSTFGSTLTFRGGSVSDLVSSLEAKVESVTGVPAAMQVLSHGSTTLAPGTSLVGSYGVVSGSTVALTLTSTPPTVAAVVHVALPMSLQPSHGTTLTFGLAISLNTLFGLMAQVEAQTGLAAAEQSLSFAASSLDALPTTALLSSVGIVDGSTVYLSVALLPPPMVVHVSLPASLSSTFGSTLTFFGVSVSDLVSSLEAKVESVTGVPAAIQVLSLGSAALAASTLPLGSYGVVSGSTMALATEHHVARAFVFVALPVSLQPSYSTTLTFGLATSADTLSGLMAKIGAQTGLAAAEQSLSLAGSLLDATPGSALLSSVGIVNGSTVHLSVKAASAVAFSPLVVHVSLPASLSTLFGSTLTFHGGSVSDLVSSLEAKVEIVTTAPAAIQVLSLGSTVLAANESTLGSYGVASGSTLALSLTGPPLQDERPDADYLTIALPPSLQTPNATSLTFAFTSWDSFPSRARLSTNTLSDLKAQIELQTGLGASEQTLSCNGFYLDAMPGSSFLDWQLGISLLSNFDFGLVSGFGHLGSTVYLTAATPVLVTHVSLPTSLSITFGSTLTFRGGSVSDLVSSLEAKVESVTGVPAVIQVLSLGSTALANGSSTLSAYGVVSGSLIVLTLTSTPLSVAAVVHVALPVSLQPSHGTTLTFDLATSSDTVSGLMAQIEAQTGLPAVEQALAFGGSSLGASSSALLSSLAVGNNSTIYLSTVLPPGYTHNQNSFVYDACFVYTSSDTVAGIMAQVEAQTGLASSELSYSFAASSIDKEPASSLLSSFGIGNGSTVYVSYKPLPKFVVHVSLPDPLSSTFGSTLTFRGGSVSDLVSSLEAKVESVTGAPAAIQVLSLGSTALAEDTSTIGSYGVVSGSTVALTLTSTPPSVAAVVHVALPVSLQSWHGTTLTFGFLSLSETVSDLWAGVQTQTGLSPAEQSLSFAGLSMDNSPGISLLGSLGIVDGSTIYLSVGSVGRFVVHVSLPASLNSTFGSTLTFRGGSVSDPVSSLEAKVESVTGVPAAVQMLSLGSTALANYASTIGSYGVVSGSTVALTLTGTPPTLAAVVHVALPVSLQLLHGTTLTFSFVTSSDTVSGLNAQVKAQTGLAVAEQSLSFAASSLDVTPGTALLSSVGIVHGSTVYLSMASSPLFVVHVSLPASLSSTFGSILTFRGGSVSDLVSSLEAKVESVTGVLAAIQVLSLGSTALANDASTVGFYGVVSGSTVALTLTSITPIYVGGGARCTSTCASVCPCHNANIKLSFVI